MYFISTFFGPPPTEEWHGEPHPDAPEAEALQVSALSLRRRPQDDPQGTHGGAWRSFFVCTYYVE